jgi:hypothetical protein
MDKLRSEEETLSVQEEQPEEEMPTEETEEVVRGLMARKK